MGPRSRSSRRRSDRSVRRRLGSPASCASRRRTDLCVGRHERSTPSAAQDRRQRAEWERTVAAAVGEIAEQVPSERLDRVAVALEELATVAPHAAANIANHLIRGQARIDSLRNVAARLGIRVAEPAKVNGKASDLTLIDPNGKKLWVIFSTTGVRGWQIGSAREIMEEIKQADAGYVGVLLLGARRQGSSEVRSTKSGTVWVVEMGEDIDERELERIMTAALADNRLAGCPRV